jgi:hypothetical protein
VGGRDLEKGLRQFHHGGAGNDAVHRNASAAAPIPWPRAARGWRRVDLAFSSRSPSRSSSAPAAVSFAWRDAAVEQQHIQCVLDLAHPVGDGAGHQAQLARGGGKAAGRATVCSMERASGVRTSRALGIFKFFE